MRIEVTATARLRFGDDDPVRAASGIAPLEDGWLVAQDDAVDAAWWRPRVDAVERVRVLPPRDDHVVFSDAAGTKHLKPDLEAACPVVVGGRPGVLLLGSGSLPARTSAVLVRASVAGLEVTSTDLTGLYERVRVAVGLRPADLNLEGACVVGDRLRWFQRGHGRTGVPSASVDVDLAGLLAALLDGGDPAAIPLTGTRAYDLGGLGGLPLAITDAVALPDGRVLASATAEDTPDAVADGPVAGSVLALLGEDRHPPVVGRLPDELRGHKVEGLALVGQDATAVRVVAVVDQDDPAQPSPAAHLTVHVDARGTTARGP